MLFAKRFWDGLADGSVTVAYRWWTRPTVKAGGTLQTRAGVLAIDAVETVTVRSVTAADAHAAGYATRRELMAALDRHRPTGARRLYRIAFHHAGADPRVTLRETADLTGDQLAAVAARLDRMDRPRPEPWTRATLELLAAHPATLAADLAASVSREKLPFKADVRRLKALGLTESLPVGYRLSPRGQVVLRHLRRRDRPTVQVWAATHLGTGTPPTQATEDKRSNP